MRTLELGTSLLLMTCTITASAGEWIGPDTLNNDWATWSISGTSSIFQSRIQGDNLQMGLLPRPYWVINQTLDHTMTATRSASVDSGKRYRFSVSGREARSVVTGDVNVEWWSEIGGGPSSPHSSSTSYVTYALDHISASSSMTLRTKARVTASYAELYYDYAEYDWGTLQQVVYDPQLDISQSAVRVNTDTPGGATATVGLTLNSLSYADDPTAWSMDWGDGIVEPGPQLNQTHAHGYALSGGDSQTWTAVFSGSNQAGSAGDSALITVLRQPDLGLTVNGTPAADGQTIELDVLNHPETDLSLLESLGYIEQAHFFIPDRLDVLGSDLSWRGVLFGAADIGQVFSLSATISNTGAGVNFDTISINLAIVPEPAAFVSFAVGSLSLRCRSARRFR